MVYRFVFAANIKEGCTVEQYVEAWRASSRIIQQQPGARGTKLHRSLDTPAGTTTLVAIASWESKAARNAAIEALGLNDEGGSKPDSIHNRHEQFADLVVYDELEEISAVNAPLPPIFPDDRDRTHL